MKQGLKFVITGGAGLIGSWVTDYILSEYGSRVGGITVLDDFSRGTRDNLKNALKSKKVKVVEGDVRDRKTVNKITKGADYVVHEAALRITQCAEDPRLGHDVLVNGTFNVLESCVKNKVKKLVFNSSASVYGQPSYIPMDENHPFNNDTLYGAAKIANEQEAKVFRKMYGLPFIALRPFNVYGTRMDVFGAYTEVLIRWLDRIDQGLPPIILGDGKQTLDFIYVEDVALATIAALKSPIKEGIYNVASGTEVSLNDVAKLLLNLTNSTLGIEYAPARSVYHVTRRKADIKKIKKELKFKPTVSLKEGLQRLIIWRREVRAKIK